MAASSSEGKDVTLWEATADAKDSYLAAPSSSSANTRIADSKQVVASEQSNGVSSYKGTKERGESSQMTLLSSIASSPSNSTTSASVNIGGGGGIEEDIRVDNYYSDEGM